MKIEARGKYPGIKVHLDETEVQAVLNTVQQTAKNSALSFVNKLGQKILTLLADEPSLLKPRTPEQIKQSIEEELEKLSAKKAKIEAGLDWKAEKDQWIEPMRSSASEWFLAHHYISNIHEKSVLLGEWHSNTVEPAIQDCQTRGWVPKGLDGALILTWPEFVLFYQEKLSQLAFETESKLLNGSKGGMKL